MNGEQLQQLKKRLSQHRRYFPVHLKRASQFLVGCQILEPYVDSGTLRGTVCPWEIATATSYGYAILEDFHDTLEAIWVWTYFTWISNQPTFLPNIEAGWDYVVANYHRFIYLDQPTQGLYDCAQLLNTATAYERAFADETYRELVEKAGNRLTQYLSTLRPTRGREYSDPWWMAMCLASAAQGFGYPDWLESALHFVQRTIVKKKKPFSPVINEPRHRGPGGHDFFSQNATKALALSACSSFIDDAKTLLESYFLSFAPHHFVSRPVDENAWNANIAEALGKSYAITGNLDFLKRYFIIMDELRIRDSQKSAALPRSETFPLRESWVTNFYARAYAAVLDK